ncbi:MAG: hypothetical protein JWN52_1970 [Actinomycetia bacterium]|nr:hypothetical protein [Actinomycetes bacterium]
MAEPPRETQARLWDQPTILWRLVALALVVFPHFATSSIPHLGDVPGTHDHTVLSAAIAVSVPDPTEQWFDYLSGSGLILLALAVAFMLPGQSGWRTTLGATWALGLFGLIAGYEARSAEGSHLGAYCLFYLLAAAVLTVAGLRSALAKADSR